MSRRRIAILALLLALAPALARADVGVSLLTGVSCLHLVVGNLLLGIAEGTLLARVFKVRYGDTIKWMIAANYVSAWAGIPILKGIGWIFHALLQGPERLYYGKASIIIATLLIFLATILIEWPFCHRILKQRPRPWRIALWASLFAQTASYAVLIPLYLASSYLSVLTATRIEKDLHFSKNPGASVYYLSPQGEAVWRRRLDGSPATKIMNVRTDSPYDRLFTLRDINKKTWDLWLLRTGAVTAENTAERLIDNFANQAIRFNQDNPGNIPSTWYNFQPANLHLYQQRDWDCTCDLWEVSCLHAKNRKQHQNYTLGMETPIDIWLSRNLTILPGDQAVYQLGDMIVLLDLNTRQLAVIAMGHGPVVGME